MTPLQINILLHYHSRSTDYGDESKNLDAPAVKDSIEWFVEKGLLQPDTVKKYAITDRGRAYVELGLAKVPLPEREWTIPWHMAGEDV